MSAGTLQERTCFFQLTPHFFAKAGRVGGIPKLGVGIWRPSTDVVKSAQNVMATSSKPLSMVTTLAFLFSQSSMCLFGGGWGCVVGVCVGRGGGLGGGLFPPQMSNPVEDAPGFPFHVKRLTLSYMIRFEAVLVMLGGGGVFSDKRSYERRTWLSSSPCPACFCWWSGSSWRSSAASASRR